MKNLSLALNIVLLVAVVVLYYLHFSKPQSRNASGAGDSTSLDLQIALINSDSVLKYYEYLEVDKQKLEEKQKKVAEDYRSRAMQLQKEITAYQRNVNNMTLGQVRATEEDLGKKQQNLQMYEQTLSRQLMEEEGKLQRELYSRVTDYLKKYGEEKGLQVVLKYDPTSDLLYGGKALDISNDVVKGLNETYQQEKLEGDKKKADSLARNK